MKRFAEFPARGIFYFFLINFYFILTMSRTEEIFDLYVKANHGQKKVAFGRGVFYLFDDEGEVKKDDVLGSEKFA